jgi:hypothetical protein
MIASSNRIGVPHSYSSSRTNGSSWPFSCCPPLPLGVGEPSIRLWEAHPCAASWVLALTFLAFVLFEVIPRALADWWGFDAWLARQQSKNFERKLSTLTDAQKAPFQMEHRCKLSPAEEIWVRHERDPQPTRGTGLSLEVLYSKNSGQTWEKLPLRLSPWARFKCIMLDGEWPPTSPSRNLSCDKDGISLEVMGADYWDNWPNVWRATYGPHRKWWTLKVIGPLWVEAFSKRMGSPGDTPARGIPDC